MNTYSNGFFAKLSHSHHETNELMLVKVKDICYKRYQNNEISELRIFISVYFHKFHVYNWENERKIIIKAT